MTKIILCFVLLASGVKLYAQTRPVPSHAQLKWHEMEYYLFMHFGPNTFTDKEWGEGNEPENVFNPTDLDCRQWCRIAKAAGAKGIIITAKHHDGFCLWPSKYSTHTVRESRWKRGTGDVLKDLSQACREYGLKFGVYISPWDRNHPEYGTPAYNDVFVNMMREIFSNYGPIWELWWDGANGEGPNGKKQVYDWKRFEETVRSLSPETVIFSDIGPGARWCGNEQGIAGKTNWNFLDTAGFTRGVGSPPVDTLNAGNYNGKNWIPAECDVSIRPGWFYHPEEDEKVKTPEQLFSLYLKSVGRGANLLLNVPPDRNGLISTSDSASLVKFKVLRDRNLSRDILKNTAFYLQFDQPAKAVYNHSTGSIELKQHKKNAIHFNFKTPEKLNFIVLGEDLVSGQNIRKFSIEIVDVNKHSTLMGGTSVGARRFISFPEVNASSVIIRVEEASAPPVFKAFRIFNIDEALVEKN